MTVKLSNGDSNVRGESMEVKLYKQQSSKWATDFSKTNQEVYIFM